MPSDLWKYSINSIKSDNRISKLDNYLQKEVKKSIKKKLLTLGTKVIVTGNLGLLKRHIQETPGLANVSEKIPFMKKIGTVIDVDKDVGHSKVCFKDNTEIWFPIKSLRLMDEVTIDTIKHVQTTNLSKAKKDCRKKGIKSLYECVQALQNTEKITPKKRLNNYLDSADKACMNLREVIHLHQKRNIKLAAITEKFDKNIKKIKRNRCFEKIKLPPI